MVEYWVLGVWIKKFQHNVSQIMAKQCKERIEAFFFPTKWKGTNSSFLHRGIFNYIQNSARMYTGDEVGTRRAKSYLYWSWGWRVKPNMCAPWRPTESAFSYMNNAKSHAVFLVLVSIRWEGRIIQNAYSVLSSRSRRRTAGGLPRALRRVGTWIVLLRGKVIQRSDHITYDRPHGGLLLDAHCSNG